MKFKKRFREFLAPSAAQPRAPRTGEFCQLEETLGYVFRDENLLREALTHPSIKSIEAGVRDFQRLEFLGDAVLGLVFAEALYGAGDTAEEGRLTDARTRLARGSNLAEVGRKLGLGTFLRLAENADAKRIRETNTAHEDALEAVFGAVFLDGGLGAVRAVAERLFAEKLSLDDASVEESRSPKNRLQELLQKESTAPVAQRLEYRVVAESGPAHARHFTVEVWVDGACRGTGNGSSKRTASEAAAEVALKNWRSANEQPRG